MKTRMAVLTAAILTTALPLAASAQTPSRAPSATETRAVRQTWAPEAGHIDSSKLVGMKVKNDLGKDIGDINALIIDQGNGQVSHVVVGQGGLLGVGERQVVLAWSDLSIQSDPGGRDRMIATVSQRKLDSAPRYEVRRDRDVTPAASPRTAPSEPLKK